MCEEFFYFKNHNHDFALFKLHLFLLPALDKIGGYEAMVNRYMPSASTNSYQYQGLYGNLSCGFPPDDSFHIFRGIESDYPWPGLTFGLTLLATYYFCTNQVRLLILAKGSTYVFIELPRQDSTHFPKTHDV